MPKNSDEPDQPRLPDLDPADPPLADPDADPDPPLTPAADAEDADDVEADEGAEDADDRARRRDTTPRPGGVNGSRVLVAVGGAVALVLVLAAGFHLMGDNGSAGGSRSPEEAVRDYFYASKGENCERLVDLITETSWSADGQVTRDKAIAMCEKEAKAAPKLDASLDRVKVVSRDGGTAVVKADLTVEKRRRTVAIKLAKEHNAWKIAGV